MYHVGFALKHFFILTNIILQYNYIPYINNNLGKNMTIDHFKEADIPLILEAVNDVYSQVEQRRKKVEELMRLKETCKRLEYELEGVGVDDNAMSAIFCKIMKKKEETK